MKSKVYWLVKSIFYILVRMTDERSYFLVLKAFMVNRKMSRELRFMNFMSSLLGLEEAGGWDCCRFDDCVDFTDRFRSLIGCCCSSNSFFVNLLSSVSYFSLNTITTRHESLETHSTLG